MTIVAVGASRTWRDGIRTGLVVASILAGLTAAQTTVAVADPAGPGAQLSGPVGAAPTGSVGDPRAGTIVAAVRTARLAAYGSVFRAPDDPAARTGPGPAGADLAGHLTALLASRPGERVADPTLVTTALDAPGHVYALRAVDGTHLMVWTSAGAPFALDTTGLGGQALRGWWFDPRTGTPIDIGSVRRDAAVELYPPVTGPQDEGLDWVLVVDDTDREFGPPGSGGPDR